MAIGRGGAGAERPEVVIEIDELDLSGVPAARRFVVAASFERELARLVDAHGPPVGRSPGGEREAPPVGDRLDGNPVILGQALARSVYEGLR